MGSSSFLTAFLNVIFLTSVALGLSGEDIKMIVAFAVLYSLFGLCLSYTIPDFLFSRGSLTEQEKKLYSSLLLVSWIVTIWLVIPKFWR